MNSFSSFSDENTCPECHTKNRPGANFCHTCGKRITAEKSTGQLTGELVKRLGEDLGVLCGEIDDCLIKFCEKMGNLVSPEAFEKRVFTDIITVTVLSLSDVVGCLNYRRSSGGVGSQAIVAKMNRQTFPKLYKKKILDFSENKLLISILSSEDEEPENILVKYDNIEPSLDAQLTKGNGFLVVDL